MAKTIHDLAVAYGKEHQGTVDIEVFEAGANAVLEIIKRAMNREHSYENDIYILHVKVQGKINELEGII